MKIKLLTLMGLCALTAALALPAAGVAATPPVTHDHSSYSGTGYPICGLSIDYQVRGTGFDLIRKNDGVELTGGSFTAIWTNPASGMSIMLHTAGQGAVYPAVDNGDGTISFIQTSSGVDLVKSTNGPPISLTGAHIVWEITFDNATNVVSMDLLSFSGTTTGPSVDSSCDSLLAALT
jgi:hypothetical protein